MTNLEALQVEVGQWATETFPEQTDWRIVQHLREEVEELREAIADADNRGVETAAVIADDCADVAILLLTLAHRCGISLADAIRAKHAVNTGRTWAFDAGRGYDKHVEEAASRRTEG